MDAAATVLTALPSALHKMRRSNATARAAGDRAHHPTLRPPTVMVVAALHIACLTAFSLAFPPGPTPKSPTDNGVPVVFVPVPPGPTAPPDLQPQILSSGTVAAQVNAVVDALAPVLPLSMMASETGLAPPPRSRAPRHTATQATRVTGRHVETAQALPPTTQPASTARAVPAPATSLPSVPTDEVLHALANWEARIRQAVQNAAIYPASARLLHREGSAQIRFDYDRGRVEGASITKSSQSGALDNAALAAVTRAAIPDPPAELGPQKRVMLVWVQFKLVATE